MNEMSRFIVSCIRPLMAVLTATLLTSPVFAADFSCDSGSNSKIVNTTLAGVPAVLRLPLRVQHRPIILWHGLGPPADPTTLMEALPLDEVNAVKVYLGLPLTGSRAPKKDSDSLPQRQKRDYATLIFQPIVVGAADELPGVVTALRQGHFMAKGDDRVDLFGFSAGGTAVLYALTQQQVKVKAAITLNAPTGLNQAIGALERAMHGPYNWSPAARQLAEQTDITRHSAQIARSATALLMLQGADDSVASATDAQALQQALIPHYVDETHLKVLVLPGVSHSWIQSPALQDIRANIATWLNRNG